MTWGAEGLDTACARRAATAVEPARREVARRELAAVTSAARTLHTLRTRPDCEVVRYPPPVDTGHDARPAYGGVPVIAVHGYGGTDAVWAPLVRALHAAGFADVSALRYDALRSDLPELAAHLVRAADEAMARTGSAGVHLVGHSLGGLIVHCGLQWPMLAARARTVVTIATPYAGAAVARLAVGPCARRMRPGSGFLSELRPRTGADTRWVVYYSPRDVVVPALSAQLHDPRLDVRNIAVGGCGHLSIARHPAVLASIVEHLAGTEAELPRSATALAMAG